MAFGIDDSHMRGLSRGVLIPNVTRSDIGWELWHLIENSVYMKPSAVPYRQISEPGLLFVERCDATINEARSGWLSIAERMTGIRQDEAHDNGSLVASGRRAANRSNALF
jgi:hypothetical protein